MTDTKTVASGHPKGLYTLFFSEMWERFCYYGMRALLTLYLINSLAKGDLEAFGIYGAYTALVYAAPVLGGRIADQLIGYRNAVVLGGILMCIGEFMILGGNDTWLYVGMGTIIVGNGYFKANISTIVGKLYADDDPRRDSGFTIFYIGINVGALLATTVCAEVGNIYGAHYGFALAGFGMILGTLIFWLGRKNFEHAALPPDEEKLHKPFIGFLGSTFSTIDEENGGKSWRPLIVLNRMQITVVLSVLAIPLLYFLIKNSELVGYLLAITAVFVIYNLISEAIKDGKVARDRMIMMIIMFVFNIVFWACFEQAGTSLTLFAERNVNRDIMGWEMGAATTQFFNPAFILIFGSIFSIMWIKLSKIGKNPSIPMKFGLGIIQLGFGYLIVYGMQSLGFVSPEFKMPLITLVFLYMLHTTGELFLSPIGLSMVTKLAPKRMTGTAMGGWFLSFAGANYVAAILAKATGTEEGHGGEAAAAGATEASEAAASLANYVDIYTQMGLITVGIGVLLVLLSKPLNKLTHGIG
ncbi:MAG: oligopeptide:H+ symporter [Bacteroidetes bacterium]|nr:oligopeptide:H+ symporter [Bacteroidota bacterium]MDA1335839.1 oligopeptide:H+ symporter [Bacteroidota bacterium]